MINFILDAIAYSMFIAAIIVQGREIKILREKLGRATKGEPLVVKVHVDSVEAELAIARMQSAALAAREEFLKLAQQAARTQAELTQHAK